MAWQGGAAAARQLAERRRERCVMELVDAVRAHREHPTTNNDVRMSDALTEFDEAQRLLDASL